MANVRPEVLWHPANEELFLVWSSSLQLYQVQNINNNEDILLPKIKLCNKTSATLLTTHSEHQFIKSLAWYHGYQEERSQNLVAVGQTNGRIALVSLTRSNASREIDGREYTPRTSRSVNSLSFNPHYHHFMAAGLDKATRDSSVLVFDVKTISSGMLDKRHLNARDALKPVNDWGSGETVHSVAFSTHSPHSLLGSVNYKQIKLYDLREDKNVGMISTKAVYGLCFDPFLSHRFASYIDSTIHIWDNRNLERPVFTIPGSTNKAIFKLSWCPTRAGFLGSLQRESISMNIYDIQHPGHGREEVEPAVISRKLFPESNTCPVYMSSFSWHPVKENRVITALYSGKFVDVNVPERVTLNWAGTNSMVWSKGKNTLHVLNDENADFVSTQDISVLIKERAVRGYGSHKEKLYKNGEAADDPSLHCLWQWLHNIKELAKRADIKLAGGFEYPGMSAIMASNSTRSDITYKPYIGIEGSKPPLAKIFKCEERNTALALCSQAFEGERDLERHLSRLEEHGEYARAAAVAVFHLNISLAINCLKNGANRLKDASLTLTAMAFAGFSLERKTLWRETCTLYQNQISDPYLRAAFTFLTGDIETYDSILNEKQILLHDRIAFACKYLSDIRLLEYFARVKEELMEEANLDALIITGFQSEGIDLLQRYLHATGDVQTLALIAVHLLSNRVSQDARLQHWVDSYRNILDSLKLWKERAIVDVIMNQGSHYKKIPQQIYISCKFCSKSISAYIQDVQTPGRSRNPFARFGTGATSKMKMNACPSCRRPLPRCALCLQYMGTPSRRGSVLPKPCDSFDQETIYSPLFNAESTKPPLSHFSSWFSWCQTCHHGGHSEHMTQWFKEHIECPVAACSCKCMSIDVINENFSSISVKI